MGADRATDGLEGADVAAFAGDSAEADAGDTAAATCGGASFTAGTKVLLASGAAVAIAKLKPGDKVLATNVKNGKTMAQTFAAVLVHYDRDLYDLTVKAGGEASVIHTTSGHLFWDRTTKHWTKAAALTVGDDLRTPKGGGLIVLGGYEPTVTTGWMWDLTVTRDHDFYLQVANTDILVHNCPVASGDGTPLTNPQASDMAARVGYRPTNYIMRGQRVFTNGRTFYYTRHRFTLRRTLEDGEDGRGSRQ